MSFTVSECVGFKHKIKTRQVFTRSVMFWHCSQVFTQKQKQQSTK